MDFLDLGSSVSHILLVRTSLAKYEKTSLSLDPKSPNFFASMLIVISGFLSLSVSVVLLCFLHRNFHFFCLQKKKFLCHAPLTTRFKFEKIERKVTESQKIKNKLAEIWTFWISGARFPIFYSFVPHSQNMKKPHFPSTQKVQISLQAC